MIKSDQQLGAPGVLYKDTKANIEALTVVEGATALSTDTHEDGFFNGTIWVWGRDSYTDEQAQDAVGLFCMW